MKECSNCKKEIENVNGEYCIFCGEKLIEIKEENEKNKEETKTEKEQINGKKPIIISENENVKQEKIKNKRIKTKRKVILGILIVIAIIAGLMYFKFNITEDIETIKNSVVMIKTYDKKGTEISTGSGFCVADNNYIVTNYHVIEGANKIEIITDENKTYQINEIVIFNKNDDLAIIKGNFELKPLKIASSIKLKAGDTITAIGSPKGQLNTVSTGIISNADNEYEIRITAPISPGSSGGVLLDKRGKVIGVTFATYNSEDSQNINYAINANYLNKMLSTLKEDNFIKITESSYTRYIGDFDKFDEGAFSNSTYYQISSLEILYKMTDTYKKFEYILRSKDLSWYEIYDNLKDEDKEKVVTLFQQLNSYTINDNNISEDIKKWNMTDFFLNLKVLQKYEYAITIVDLNNYKSKEKMIKQVNEKYPLKAAEKALILYLLGDFSLEDVSEKNKKDIINYFDEKYYNKDTGAILEMLGFTVKYKKSGGLTISW